MIRTNFIKFLGLSFFCASLVAAPQAAPSKQEELLKQLAQNEKALAQLTDRITDLPTKAVIGTGAGLVLMALGQFDYANGKPSNFTYAFRGLGMTVAITSITASIALRLNAINRLKKEKVRRTQLLQELQVFQTQQ
jgi:hypothetical protein